VRRNGEVKKRSDEERREVGGATGQLGRAVE
jgi:hypothetical protein